MRVPKNVYPIFVIALLASLLPLTPAAQPGMERAPIEQELLDAFAVDGSASFFVKMAVEADLSEAYEMAWEARGQFVYNALWEVATATQAPAIAYAEKHGLDYASFLTTNAVFVRSGTQDVAYDLAALPGVAYLRLERILQIPDPQPPRGAGIQGFREGGPLPEAGTDWGILDTKAEQAWALGARGAGIKVSSIDSGVQWNHPALAGQFACDSPSDPQCWKDPSDTCGGSACDNVGHGTHTMGTMVAADNPELLYTAGMAPDATWITCKGCESMFCSDFALTTCADWIVAPAGDPGSRPHVVNNSWGGGGGDPWYQSYVNAWRAAGIFPAFSAGNSGMDCNSLGSPGDYQQSFGSAAHDTGRAIAFFSSRGPSAFGHDPYTKPNISAPGVSICSTVPINDWACDYSGTSMASPHTAGAVALIWSACPDYLGQMDATFELLQDNADVPPAGNCGAPPDGEGNYTYGYGYLNVLAAVQQCAGGLEVGTLEGHVYDEAGDPIAGAAVTVQPAARGASVEAATDPDGYYTMPLLPGAYDVRAFAYGYASETVPGVVIVANQATVQDFSLSSAPVWRVGAPAAFDLYRFDGAYNPHDGLIYFLGGRSGAYIQDRSIRTYDPATGASADTGKDMLYNASGITIALIEDDGTGRGEAMYVVGGYDIDALEGINKVQRFYPQLGVVEEVATDPYPDVVSGHIVGASGVAAVDDKIYVFGGWQNEAAPYFSAKTWAFDPQAPAGTRWTDLGCNLSPARGNINTAVSDGKIYALGGIYWYDGEDLYPTNAAQVFDPGNPGACWQSIAGLPVLTAEGRGFGFDADAKNPYGKVYVVGGGDWPDTSAQVFSYDIASNTWSQDTAGLTEPRREHAGAFVSACTPDARDGLPGMWIFGGYIYSDDPPYGDPEYYPLPCQGEVTMHVQFIRLAPVTRPGGGRLVVGLMRVVNGNNEAVGGASVDMTWILPIGDGYYVPVTRQTRANGVALSIMLGRWSGTYQLCVDNVAAEGYVYDADQNNETCDAITLP